MNVKFPNNAKCIYLDQFATSELFRAEIDPIWEQIRDELFKGHKLSRLFCPLSAEHFLESSKMSYERAKVVNKAFESLSNGYAFKSELFITSQLMISTIRKNNITAKTFLYDKIKPDLFSNKEEYNEFRKLNDDFDIKISETTSPGYFGLTVPHISVETVPL